MDVKNDYSMEENETKEKIRKRRYSACSQNKTDPVSDGGESPERKFRLITTPPFRLMDFSDEVLFEIFKYLDTWTLMALMNCCTRLSSLILDHRFWNYIDLSKEPLPLGILEDVLERSQGNTTCIKLHGPPVAQHLEREDKQFSQTLAKAFKNCCINLNVLELQGITIDFRYVRITDFPISIKRLRLNDCNVRFEGEKSIFFGIDAHLTKLEELAIENSNWFEPYYMMVFSKVPELRSLSLKGCQLLSDFVPYGSMAARFGFKKLEFLDLRFTPISDSDIQCFNAVATLKEVLLDCPESLRENNTEIVQDTKVKIRNCYCHSRPNCEKNNSNDINNESPSTSTASRLKITVSISPSNNESGPSTSAAAAAQQSQQSSAQLATSQQQEQPIVAREEDSSSSSCSSSPSASSTSSNESLPPLLGNQQRHMPRNPIELPLELPIQGGNAPPFSRFLPRPDQIILLDLNNRWRRVVMQNANSNRENPAAGDEQQQQQERQQQQQLQQLEQQQQAEIQPEQQQGLYEQIQQLRERLQRFRERAQQRQQQHQHQQQQEIFEMQRPQIFERQRHNWNQNNNNNNNNNNNINNNNNNDNNNGNPNNNNNNNNNHHANRIEQVLNHPLFWDMINPFARVGRPRRSGGNRGDGGGDDDDIEQNEIPRVFDSRRSQCSGQYHQYHRHRHRSHHHPISDRGICCFGRPRNPVEHGIIWIRIGNRPSENRFERLSIRNYKLVTDISLQHLVQCSPYLVYLDLSGTGVTQRGIDAFKERKPQCVIVADHLTDYSSNKPNCTGDCIEIQDTI